MAYQISTFAGDAAHAINCTGDCVVGDQVAFERAVFGGSLRKPKFVRFDMVVGAIVADSYGSDKQQHTFTLQLADGSKTLIKGRNLYANGTYRQRWADEADRKAVAIEKHERGDHARAARGRRVEERAHAGF